ncbi:MAG: hypothetical protein JSR41_05160 [Proteobacteria bacterium]|nr:hypothetical protein [Pseudomonadota bacterium]
MDEIPPPLWIAACAHHLHQHWRTLGPQELEDTARELMRDPQLRKMPPAEAAAQWLQPVEGKA